MKDINLEVSKLKEEAVGILHRLHTAQILSNSPFSSSPDVDPHNEHVRLVECLTSAAHIKSLGGLQSIFGGGSKS